MPVRSKIEESGDSTILRLYGVVEDAESLLSRIDSLIQSEAWEPHRLLLVDASDSDLGNLSGREAQAVGMGLAKRFAVREHPMVLIGGNPVNTTLLNWMKPAGKGFGFKIFIFEHHKQGEAMLESLRSIRDTAKGLREFPMPGDEPQRLKALRRYALNRDPEEQFDRITTLASYICQTPIALISVVEEETQWFKSKVGFEASSTSRETAFCAHAILDNELMVVNDAREDARFAKNPLVRDSPNIRFYAGMPIVSPDDFKLGTLCVIDNRPRELSEDQAGALRTLAQVAMTEMELRRTSADLALALTDVKSLQQILPMCSHCKRIRDDEGYWSQVEAYVEAHTGSHLTHSICPECLEAHYPEATNPGF